MAFVCPTKCDAENRTQMLHDLKHLVGKLENELTVNADPVCIPMCVPICPAACAPCCAPCCPPCPPPEDDKPCEVPESMVCYRVTQKQSNKKKHKNDRNDNMEQHKVKESASRELRSSVLYKGCDCERRNGLQDDCPRSDCHGSPACLSKPSPNCGPSAYCDGKHLLSKLNKKRNAGNGGNSELDGGENVENSDTTYICFPARINPPKMCMPCLVTDCCCNK